jgi:hypothetical protein
LTPDETLALAMIKNTGELDLAKSPADVEDSLGWLTYMAEKMPTPLLEALRRMARRVLGDLRREGVTREGAS